MSGESTTTLLKALAVGAIIGTDRGAASGKPETLLHEAAMLGAKARALGDIVVARTATMGLAPISPTDAARRGGHVSLRHEHGYAVVQALIARGIIPDFRAPDAMRFGVAPLYVRFVDVWDAMDALADILATRAWDRPEFHARAAVT